MEGAQHTHGSASILHDACSAFRQQRAKARAQRRARMQRKIVKSEKESYLERLNVCRLMKTYKRLDTTQGIVGICSLMLLGNCVANIDVAIVLPVLQTSIIALTTGQMLLSIFAWWGAKIRSTNALLVWMGCSVITTIAFIALGVTCIHIDQKISTKTAEVWEKDKENITAKYQGLHKLFVAINTSVHIAGSLALIEATTVAIAFFFVFRRREEIVFERDMAVAKANVSMVAETRRLYANEHMQMHQKFTPNEKSSAHDNYTGKPLHITSQQLSNAVEDATLNNHTGFSISLEHFGKLSEYKASEQLFATQTCDAVADNDQLSSAVELTPQLHTASILQDPIV